jgi:hypothetical protein
MPLAKGTHMPRIASLLLAPLVFTSAALTCACNVDVQSPLNPGPSVAMQDSFELDLLGPATDDLHTPYVNGAKFDITIATTGYTATATTSWSLESGDSTVIRVDGSTSPGNFQVETVGTGHTTLSVVDAKGNVLDTHGVDVAEPDSVQLCAHGLLLGGLSDAQAQVTQASVLEGGTATFLVRYFQGSQELWGNNAVRPTGTGAVTAMTTTSSFGDDRDWVEVDAAQPGTGQVSLVVGGSTMAVIPTTVVASSAIQSVGALAQSDANASNGNTLYVFARAFDAQGGDVYGASFAWQVGGAAVSSALTGSSMPSDVLSYTYSSSASETVSDELGSFASPLITIHGTGAAVESTAEVGCSVARAAGSNGAAGGGLVLVLGAAAMLWVRRRREARLVPAERMPPATFIGTSSEMRSR